MCGRIGGELVAADPVGAVARPPIAQDLRDALDHGVAVGMPVAVVQELEVVDVEHHERQRLVEAGRGRDGLRELVVERALVRQVGHPVARRLGECPVMPPDHVSSSEDVEERNTHDQARASDHEQRPADVCELGVEGRVVVRGLVRVLGPRELHRGDELEVAEVAPRVALVTRVRSACAEDVHDARIRVPGPDGAMVIGCDDLAVLVENLCLQCAGALPQDGQDRVDLDEGRGRREAVPADRLEDLDVASLHRRVLGDLRAASVPVDDREADDLDHRERHDEAEEQPKREAQATVAGAARRTPAQPDTDHGLRGFRERRHAPRDRPRRVVLHTAKW